MSTDSDQPNNTSELPLDEHHDDRARQLVRAHEIAGLPRPPIEVLPLGYAPVDPNRSGVPLYRQFLAGFFFPIAYAIPAGYMAAALPGEWTTVAGWAAVIAFMPLVALVRAKTRWTAFLPGVLAMVFGLPLLAAGVCAIILAGGGFHF